MKNGATSATDVGTVAIGAVFAATYSTFTDGIGDKGAADTENVFSPSEWAC